MDVFISYARANEAQSVLVEDVLRSSGFNVWRDNELPAHRAYAEVIEERLRSAKAVVVLWSAEAAKSQWVRAEADAARNAGTLVQASLDGTIPPLPFNQIHSADLRGWNGRADTNGWRKLMGSVTALTGAEHVAPAKSRSLPMRSNTRRVALAAALVAAGAMGAVGFRYFHSSEPQMLAILPFQASNGVDGNLADGLSEELISQLSQNDDLRVIGRSSAWQYKGKAVDLRTVGRQLDADYLVDGNVARVGKQLRVSVSVVRANDGSTVWSQIYKGSDLQTAQIRASIGSGIMEALGIRQEANAGSYKPKGEAYALYLKAKALFRQRTPTSMENARALMLEAIRIDPRFAPPWAYAGGITNLLGEKSFVLDSSRPDSRSLTPRQALEHAVKLDPNFADAHGFLGWIGGAWSIEGARHLQRAFELSPNDPQILYWYGQGLYRQGNFDRYAEVNRRAAALDPLWHLPVGEAASASLWAGDQVAIRRYVQKIRAGNPVGAVEVESSLAAQQGDLSRVIELALRGRDRDRWISKVQAAISLLQLGFEREGRLVGEFGPQAILYNSQNVPARATLLELANQDPERFDYVGAFEQLRYQGRYGDIVALYDAATNSELRRATFANREIRLEQGGTVAQALQKVGRNAEAAQMMRRTDDADQAIMSGTLVPPYLLIDIAANTAVAGRREEAIELLQQASSRGYFIVMPITGKIDPIWENLRDDPRFQRIAQAALAHVQKERREVLALGIL